MIYVGVDVAKYKHQVAIVAWENCAGSWKNTFKISGSKQQSTSTPNA
ncbi:hypothetical protein SAMN04488072_101248 [Lentibacillus halodurans]|uniref:Uncharacterized protein n=1 Tax=Lentibacillus halodurans TaxID=237679 RepID=A0A1I0V8H3_9BACI|nr:hypothetical protein SAMN04488072_101248 [Lentibacillus halodurans]